MSNKLSNDTLIELYQTTLDQSDSLIIMLDENFHLIRLNRIAAKKLRLNLADNVGKAFFDLLDKHNIHSPFTQDQLSNIKNKTVIEIEKPLIIHNLLEENLLWKIYKNTSVRSGKIFYFILANITNKHADLVKRLKRNEEFVHNIIENLPEYVYWKDINSIYLGCNKQLAKAAGLESPEDIIGKTDFDFGWPEERVLTLHEADKTIIDKGKRSHIEETFTIPSTNQSCSMLTNKVPLHGEDGSIIGILGISTDITERKKTEAELLKAKEETEIANEAKTQFIANMSHDFRTPLVAVKGLAEILRRQDKMDEYERCELANKLEESAELLLCLVEDVMEFSAIKAGKLPIISEPFDLRRLVDNLISVMTPQTLDKNLKLITFYSNECPRFVIGDRNRVNRIILNLLNNAIKFTAEGYICLSIDLLEKNNHEVNIQIAVEDTGIGIPEKKLPYIFDRFTRVDPSDRSPHRGTGLGLNIVKDFVESMRGTINVNSHFGEGSIFYCTILFKLQDVLEAQSEWANHYKNTRVLIIDDYPNRAENMLAQIATQHNLFIGSEDAIETLEKSYQKDTPYDIVIIDDQTEYVSSKELAKTIHNSKHLPQPLLLLMLSTDHAKNWPQYQQQGFHHYVRKPYDSSDLTLSLVKYWKEWANHKKDLETLIKEYQPKILMCEDNEIVATVQKSLLEEIGCIVDVAQDGKTCLNYLTNNNYDLALLDLGLPDMSGIELVEKIRFNETSEDSMPLIALSAHTSKQDQDKCIECGFTEYLQKPASLEQLKDVIDKHLLH